MLGSLEGSGYLFCKKRAFRQWRGTVFQLDENVRWKRSVFTSRFRSAGTEDATQESGNDDTGDDATLEARRKQRQQFATATNDEEHRPDDGTETFFKNFPKTGVNPRTDPVDITVEG
jgi:hypothetical protein